MADPAIGTPAGVDAAARRQRGVRRSALAFSLIALAFYLGFIVMTLVKAAR